MAKRKIKRKVVTSSNEFISLVLDVQARYRKKGRIISQARATKIIADAFKKRGMRGNDNFVWL